MAKEIEGRVFSSWYLVFGNTQKPRNGDSVAFCALGCNPLPILSEEGRLRSEQYAATNHELFKKNTI